MRVRVSPTPRKGECALNLLSTTGSAGLVARAFDLSAAALLAAASHHVNDRKDEAPGYPETIETYALVDLVVGGWGAMAAAVGIYSYLFVKFGGGVECRMMLQHGCGDLIPSDVFRRLLGLLRDKPPPPTLLPHHMR